MFEDTSYISQNEQQVKLERAKQRKLLFRKYAETLQGTEDLSLEELDTFNITNSSENLNKATKELKIEFDSQNSSCDDDISELERIAQRCERRFQSIPASSPRLTILLTHSIFVYLYSC